MPEFQLYLDALSVFKTLEDADAFMAEMCALVRHLGRKGQSVGLGNPPYAIIARECLKRGKLDLPPATIWALSCAIASRIESEISQPKGQA